MLLLRFEWDEAKNLSNQRKHGISFEVAAQVFRDPMHLSLQDRETDGELRWQTFGLVGDVLVLMVAHTVHDAADPETVIRIISARKATRQERELYDRQDL